ncbi:MAG: hypothetical protein KDC27_01390 [Acidobacteria bacterium]|nr:hypothetical protein [Acidobacteriota bacterium]
MSAPHTGIFLIGKDGELTGLREEPYEQELVLQTLISRYPQILSGSPRRFLLIRQEAPVRHGENGATGWLDHLFLDDLGVPTLVEVKRSTDARIRREVVGQLLDYAANVAFDWDAERLQDFFEGTCETAGRESAEALEEFLEGETPVDQYWETVKTNLQAGKIRLLFVADRIPTDLRRIIEFLNNQMDPCEVLGVEIRQFNGGGVQTLVPSIVGQTVEAEERKRVSTPGNNWDEESFFERLEQTADAPVIGVATKLLQWSKRNSKYVWWGKGKTQGSFVPSIRAGDSKHNPFAVFSGAKGDPVVEIYFQWLAGKPAFSEETKRRELLDMLNAIDGVNLPEDSISRRPSIPLAVLAEGDRAERFLRVFDWYLGQIGATPA